MTDGNQEPSTRTVSERRGPNKNYREKISLGLVVSATALGFTVATWILDGYDELRALINTNALCCRSYETYQVEDSGQRRYWVNVIGEINTHVSQLDSKVSRIDAEMRDLQDNRRRREE